MVAEELLGVDQTGEAGGGVVDGGGELEMLPSTGSGQAPTGVGTGFEGLDTGESFNEMLEVAAHGVDLVLEGWFLRQAQDRVFVHLDWWGFTRDSLPRERDRLFDAAQDALFASAPFTS